MPEGKYFRIRSRMNGLVLDIEGGEVAEGVHVITWEAKDEEYDNQLWRADPLTRSIRTKVDESFCLDINEDNKLVVNPYSDSESQKWKVSGDRVLKYTDSSVCLDIARKEEDPGAKICSYEFRGQDNQLWDFEYEQPEFFFLRSAMHDKVIDVFGGSSDEGTRICCWPKKDDPEDNQMWYEDKHCYIRSKLNDMVLDASGGEICLHHHDSGSDRQRWVLTTDGLITNVDRQEEVFDIKAQCEDDGACIIAWRRNGQANQQWLKDVV